MELLERERSLDELNSALNHVAASNGRNVLIAGEAGIGKTALVEHFVAMHRQSADILWGGCDALFTPRPLGPLYDITHQTRMDLRALLNRKAPRVSIFNAFIDELHEATRPTIVVFEDVHWADEATLDLIKFVGRRIHRTRAMLILTYRNDELAANHPFRLVLGDLPGGSVTRLSLSLLSEGAVSAMAQRAARPSEGSHAATGGNPFFVTEVLASTTPGVPGTVRDVVIARAARLSAPARDVVELVSVAPARMERWLIDDILAPGSSALDECTGAGMLRLEHAIVTFRHELARQAIEDALPPARRQRLHAMVLRAWWSAVLTSSSLPDSRTTRSGLRTAMRSSSSPPSPRNRPLYCGLTARPPPTMRPPCDTPIGCLSRSALCSWTDGPTSVSSRVRSRPPSKPASLLSRSGTNWVID